MQEHSKRYFPNNTLMLSESSRALLNKKTVGNSNDSGWSFMPETQDQVPDTALSALDDHVNKTFEERSNSDIFGKARGMFENMRKYSQKAVDFAYERGDAKNNPIGEALMFLPRVGAGAVGVGGKLASGIGSGLSSVGQAFNPWAELSLKERLARGISGAGEAGFTAISPLTSAAFAAGPEKVVGSTVDLAGSTFGSPELSKDIMEPVGSAIETGVEFLGYDKAQTSDVLGSIGTVLGGFLGTRGSGNVSPTSKFPRVQRLLDVSKKADEATVRLHDTIIGSVPRVGKYVGTRVGARLGVPAAKEAIVMQNKLKFLAANQYANNAANKLGIFDQTERVNPNAAAAEKNNFISSTREAIKATDSTDPNVLFKSMEQKAAEAKDALNKTIEFEPGFGEGRKGFELPVKSEGVGSQKFGEDIVDGVKYDKFQHGSFEDAKKSVLDRLKQAGENSAEEFDAVEKLIDGSFGVGSKKTLSLKDVFNGVANMEDKMKRISLSDKAINAVKNLAGDIRAMVEEASPAVAEQLNKLRSFREGMSQMGKLSVGLGKAEQQAIQQSIRAATPGLSLMFYGNPATTAVGAAYGILQNLGTKKSLLKIWKDFTRNVVKTDTMPSRPGGRIRNTGSMTFPQRTKMGLEARLQQEAQAARAAEQAKAVQPMLSEAPVAPVVEAPAVAAPEVPMAQPMVEVPTAPMAAEAPVAKAPSKRKAPAKKTTTKKAPAATSEIDSLIKTRDDISKALSKDNLPALSRENLKKGFDDVQKRITALKSKK